jgi:hypothetical protein
MASSTHPSHPAGAADAEPGWRVARVACQRANAALGARLISAYAIGSLAHGGFAPDVSDIDIAVLVGAPPEAARLGAIDRLDLIEHGVLMHGIDRRADNGVRPTCDELVAETAAFLSYWETQRRDPDELIASGARVLTKQVLFPVRLLYTHATGRAGANQDARALRRMPTSVRGLTGRLNKRPAAEAFLAVGVAASADVLLIERWDTHQPIFCASSTMIPAGPRT